MRFSCPLTFLLALALSSGLASALRAEPAPANAATPFSATLSPADQAAAGFSHLTPTQLAALNALIQRDLDSARQGDVVAFARSFSDRRTPEEQTRAGLTALTDAERTQLNRLVAAAIASRPTQPFIAPASADTPLPAHVVETKRSLETHGQVSLFYGASSGGGSWYGGSVDTWVTDPNHKFTVGVGLTEIHTRGLRGCYDGPIW